MKKNTLFILLWMALQPASGQYFEKLGTGLSFRTFFHQQGINYYIHDMDSSGKVYAIYYDTVTSAFNLGHEYSQVRLQIFNGISWLFSRPIKLYNRYSVDAPRILDIRVSQNSVYVCGSFDSSENNLGAGILRFSGSSWESCNAGLMQTNPDYMEVNKCYPFGKQLLISGNFDSIPDVKVNGLLLWNGVQWQAVGTAGKYGFRNLSGTSNVFFQVVNDSLYAFNKNKITPDSIEIGGQVLKKLAVFRNRRFEQINVPARYIHSLCAYRDKLVVIPSSSLVYVRSFLVNDGGTWENHHLTDSFYSTAYLGSMQAEGNLNLVFQNGNKKSIDRFVFDGQSVSNRPSFTLSDIYLPLETRNINEGMTFSGNFRQVKSGRFQDSFHAITKLVLKPVAMFSGITFLDLNSDGIRQVSEPVLPNCKVYSQDNRFMALSNGDGRFNMRLPLNLTVSLNAISDKGYQNAQPQIISPTSDSVYNMDIGLHGSDNNDFSVKIFSHTAHKAKQGFQTFYTVHVNNYTASAKTSTIDVHFNSSCTQFSYKGFSPLLKTRDNMTIRASIPAHGKKSFTFSCVYEVDSFEIGQPVFVSASLQEDDAVRSNNRDTVRQLVSAAFDPNIKVASPDIVVNAQKEINYTIFFQNLGNDTALNVTVVDSFGTLFNLSKVVCHGTGPRDIPFDIVNNVLIWHFRGINLPPKKHDSLGSIGYISLSAAMSSNARLGDTVFNKAAIFFDYQKPVITNKATVIFRKPTSIVQTQVSNGFSVFPNPGKGTFSYHNSRHLMGNLNIYSTDGRLVYTVVLDERGIIELPMVSPGIYILVADDPAIEIGKLIVSE
jgi:hypothetical protein